MSSVAQESLSQNSPVILHIGSTEREFLVRKTEGQKLESAKQLCLAKNLDFQKLDLGALNEASRVSLVRDFVKRGDLSFVPHIDRFQLPEGAKYDVAKSLLPAHSEGMMEYVYDILPHFNLSLKARTDILLLTLRQPSLLVPNLLVAICPEESLCCNALWGMQEGRPSKEIEGLESQWRTNTPSELTDDLIRFIQKTKTSDAGEEDLMVSLALATVDYWRMVLSKEELAWVSRQGFFGEIFSLEAPYLRLPLIYSVVANTKNLVLNDLVIRGVARPNLLKLPLARLSEMPSCGSLLSSIKEGARELKNTKNFVILWTALDLLSKNGEIRDEQAAEVLHALSKNPKQLLKQAGYLSVILQCNRADLLQTIKQQDLLPLAKLALASTIPFSRNQDMDAFMAVFSAYRQPDAILRYAANLNTLKNPEIMASLADHISSVLDGTYRKNRYSTEGNVHLHTIGEKFPEVLSRWQQNDEPVPLGTLVPNLSGNHNMHEWLMSQMLETDFLGHPCGHLRAYLSGDEEALDQLKNLVQIEKNKEERSYLSLQNKFCQLTRSTTIETSQRLIKELLHNDLIPLESKIREGLVEKLEEMNMYSSLKEFSCSETDSAEDMILVGSEMITCQYVGGDPQVNQGLLGYLHNGQNRLIAIKDREGRVVARSLIRLLWDGQKPVLFLEKLYSSDKNFTPFASAILSMAKNLADRLGCPLASNEIKSETIFPNLQSLGGKALEYVDAVGGLWPRGEFAMSGAHLIYCPQLSSASQPLEEQPNPYEGTDSSQNSFDYSLWGQEPESNPYAVVENPTVSSKAKPQNHFDDWALESDVNPYACPDEIYQ